MRHHLGTHMSYDWFLEDVREHSDLSVHRVYPLKGATCISKGALANHSTVSPPADVFTASDWRTFPVELVYHVVHLLLYRMAPHEVYHMLLAYHYTIHCMLMV